MSPHPDPVGLDVLFEQVDGWFADFTAHEPISHYARVRKKKATPAAKSGVGNHRKQTLDSLAKDLELLLEEPDVEDTIEEKSEPNIFHFNICNNDELALLDDSIGSCHVTYGEIKDEDAMNWTKIDGCDGGGKVYSVCVQSQDDNSSNTRSYDNQPNSINSSSSNNNISNNRENNDLKVHTQMPIDHDYLPKPRAKSMNLDNQYLSIIRSKQMDISVLHTGVIKRFARFSSKFRELSLRNDRSLIAINNSQ